MQMRFDGVIGFPGGIVDPGEDPVHGVNRELHEEIGLDLEKYRMKQENHARTYLHEKKKLILHFFVNAVALQDFKHIEKMNLSAEEYGVEVRLKVTQWQSVQVSEQGMYRGVQFISEFTIHGGKF